MIMKGMILFFINILCFGILYFGFLKSILYYDLLELILIGEVLLYDFIF